jgi:cytochrome c oxidase assembly factor CtaG
MANVVSKADVPEHLRGRVDKMFRGDSLAAITLITVLWLMIFFVILAVRSYMPPGVEIVCWIAAAIMLLYNTASIVAMLRHYSDDKAHIYPIDIHHLDARR